MSRTIDEVFASLKNAKGAGDVWRALSQDKAVLVGVVAVVALVLFFLRIYLRPWQNPFTWMSDLWTWWTTPPPPTAEASYPYAKDLYPTYR